MVRIAQYSILFTRAITVLALSCSLQLHAQPGALDPSFNPSTGANGNVQSTVVQADGKIIIGGGFSSYNDTGRSRIARVNTDGSLDTGFDPGTGAEGTVGSIAMQADGKIIIGGSFLGYNGTARNFIARLNADGSLDTGFDTGGVVATSSILSIAVQADGKIIVGGGVTNRIVRLNVDGSVDTSFDPGTGPGNSVQSIAIQPDGRIIIGGLFTSYNGTARNRIARLNTDGSLDATFDPGTGANGNVRSTVVQGDGKIIIGGDLTSYNGTGRNRIARLNADGSLDTGFDPGTGSNGNILHINEQADGKIIIAGEFTSYDGTGRNRIARLNPDGSLDASFDPGTGASGTVKCTAVQADGKIIIGGEFTSYNGTGRNRLARIFTCEAGTPCNDGNACTTNDVFGSDCLCAGIVADADGDGTCDANDGCPNDPNKIAAGTCGCGVSDADSDSDGILDCNDSCPAVPGQVGSFCDDGDPITSLSQLNAACLCEAVGMGNSTVIIRVEDEFTYFAPGAPLVAGAYVMLFDPVTMMVFADGTTGPSGILTFTGVPAGTIGCAASALNHESYSFTFIVVGDLSSTHSPFLRSTTTFPIPPFDVDADGDGYFASQDGVGSSSDCNDNDPSVNPGAIEICGDGLDNDCDGVADELHISYPDLDGDGFGDPATDSLTCSVPAGHVTNNMDQCPNDPLKTTAGICGCGVADTDSDGDGTADCVDGCPNDPLNTSPGICGCGVTDSDADGICDPDDCAPNNAAVFPGAPEICDGLDNDCNGTVDDGLIPGLKLYLPLTGNAQDASGNDHHGTVFNASLVSGHTGTANTAYAFDGVNTLIEVPDHADLRPASFTLATWFYYDAVPGDVRCMVNKPLCGGFSDSYQFWFQNGQLHVGWGYGPNNLDYYAFPAPAAGQWHHVALTVNDNTDLASVFVDNVLLGTYPVTQPIAYDNTGFVLGADYENCGLGFYFNGRIDETVLFDRPLSSAEIDDLYADGPLGFPQEVCDGVDNDCDGQVDEGCAVAVSARVFLEGAYNTGTGLMNDALRSLGLVPTTEPYTGLGYAHLGGGGESTSPAVLAISGTDAIVDWVLLELRSSADPANVLATRSALVQRDGDVVDVDGISPVSFNLPPGSYHLAVLHRNHLACMTANAFSLSASPQSVDLTNSNTPTFGTEARKSSGGKMVMWAGDVIFDGQLIYTGQDNDRDPILSAIGGTVPTATISGYRSEDVNPATTEIYTGQDNDRDPILQNIGGTVPTAIREAQLP